MKNQFTDKKIYDGVKAGDTRALSRLITLSENGSDRARKIQAKLYRDAKKAHVVGITGPPGAGKSTLVDCIAREIKKSGKKVAVLAVDPSSPFSGGAILGDRIRMVKTSEDDDIFIRSMATRGALGGLSHATLDAVHILESANYDVILIETVGVGQAEVDIVRSVDTCVVVLVPGLGDSVQAIKAGILEIADIFVVNKADKEGADRVHRDLRFLLTHGTEQKNDWEIPIQQTVALRSEGVPDLIENFVKHKEWLNASTEGELRRKKVIESRILTLATDVLYKKISHTEEAFLEKLVLKCHNRKIDIYKAVDQLLSKI